jgi:hypothetical protein
MALKFVPTTSAIAIMTLQMASRTVKIPRTRSRLYGVPRSRSTLVILPEG